MRISENLTLHIWILGAIKHDIGLGMRLGDYIMCGVPHNSVVF